MIVGGIKLNESNKSGNVINSNGTDILNENVKRFWLTDSYGINPKLQLLTSDEKRALTILENTTTLPHHGVVNVDKLGTVEVIFDASPKCDNISLNDKLVPGIDYLNSLTEVLTNLDMESTP